MTMENYYSKDEMAYSLKEDVLIEAYLLVPKDMIGVYIRHHVVCHAPQQVEICKEWPTRVHRLQ